MKTKPLTMLCSVLAILLLGGSVLAADNYLELTNGSEKWYRGVEQVGPQSHRMHTLVSNYQDGLFKMRREFLTGNEVVRVEDCLFDQTDEGDIFYHGTLQDGVFNSPILWVNTPLAVGKTWRDSRQYDLGGSDETVHYVFAVLEEELITCPAGSYRCFQVILTVIYPDGIIENSSFWYNYHCGMIRCNLANSPNFEIYKSFINPHPGPEELVPHEFNPDEFLVRSPLGAPNPANPMTDISFELKQPTTVDVEVFDISGRLIKRLAVGESMPAGPVSIRWQGKDEQGQAVASGTYLCRVKAGKSVSTNRITLVR